MLSTVSKRSIRILVVVIVLIICLEALFLFSSSDRGRDMSSVSLGQMPLKQKRHISSFPELSAQPKPRKPLTPPCKETPPLYNPQVYKEDFSLQTSLPPNIDMKKIAYITSITSSSYVPGALVMAKSLHNTGSPVQRVVLITEDVHQNDVSLLETMYHNVILVDKIESPYSKNLIQKRWETTFTKLQIWAQTQFHKLVFLDADVIVRSNIDHMFNFRALSAAMDCCDHFNSGVMVLEPSLDTYRDMMDNLDKYPSYDASDQGFLQSKFHANFYPMSFRYNVDQMTILNTPHGVSFDDIIILHYVNYKPWKYPQIPDSLPLSKPQIAHLKKLHALWWEIHAQL
mmetsp:Transcript_1671/g.5843  ORF Transcript_1671/g.5843 Transcript_1671/m.5843 type:complete len:342 (+) Transcript_1671:86-1111(+)